MKTTINLDDDLLREAMKATGITRKTDLLNNALRALVRRAAQERIVNSAGSIPGVLKVFYHSMEKGNDCA